MNIEQKSTELIQFRPGPGKFSMMDVRDDPYLAAVFKGIYLVITEHSLQGALITLGGMDLKWLTSDTDMECLIHF